MGSDFVSLGSSSIFEELIEFKAILVEFKIDKPISLYSPVNGTIKPILTLSVDKAGVNNKIDVR